jgi:hypothetical protein
MKLFTENYPTATWSHFTAPDFAGATGGVCPQAGFRRVDNHAVKLGQVSFPIVGATGAGMGDRSWSPLIT